MTSEGTSRALSSSSTLSTTTSKGRLWLGRVLSGVAVLFFLVDGGMKLVKPPAVVKATVELGYPESAIVGIGTLLLVCTLLYLIPPTAMVGATLLTGYLGGAVAAHVRAGNPLFNILFPVVFGVFVWGGLWLRNDDVRRLLPILAQSEMTGSSRLLLRVGRVLSGLVSLFFLLNGTMALLKPPEVVEGTLRMGYPESTIVVIGVLLLTCTIVYLIPRTVVLGAVLLTGYLGGAVSTHVRISDTWGNIFIPVVCGVLVWVGLSLRNSRVRGMMLRYRT